MYHLTKHVSVTYNYFITNLCTRGESKDEHRFLQHGKYQHRPDDDLGQPFNYIDNKLTKKQLLHR